MVGGHRHPKTVEQPEAGPRHQRHRHHRPQHRQAGRCPPASPRQQRQAQPGRDEKQRCPVGAQHEQPGERPSEGGHRTTRPSRSSPTLSRRNAASFPRTRPGAAAHRRQRQRCARGHRHRGKHGVHRRGHPQHRRRQPDEHGRPSGLPLGGQRPHGDQHQRAGQACHAHQHQRRAARPADADSIQRFQAEHGPGRVALHMDGIAAQLVDEPADEHERVGRRVPHGSEVFMRVVQRCAEARPSAGQVDRQGPSQADQPGTGEQPHPAQGARQPRPPDDQRAAEQCRNDQLRGPVGLPQAEERCGAEHDRSARVPDVLLPGPHHPEQTNPDDEDRQPRGHAPRGPAGRLIVDRIRRHRVLHLGWGTPQRGMDELGQANLGRHPRAEAQCLAG